MADLPANNTGVGGFTESYDDMIHSRFDWFREKKLQNLVKGRRRIKIYPITANEPYAFIIPANPKKWTDMQTLRFHARYRVWNVTRDSAPADTENFSLVNNIHHSMWAQISIRVNGDEFEDATTTTYPFKAYIQTLLNTDNYYKEIVLGPTSAWAYDTGTSGTGTSLNPYKTTTGLDPNDFDDSTTEDVMMSEGPDYATWSLHKIKKRLRDKDEDYNEGYVKRRKGISTGSWVDFQMVPQHDLITTKEIFEPNTRYDIVMTRMKDDFCFIQPASNTDQYRIDLENICFTVEQVEVTAATNNYHQSKKRSGKTPTAQIRRNMIKYYPVEHGKMDLGQSNIFFTAPLPEQVYIFFVDQAAFHGTKHTNPFHFENLKIAEASLQVNGVNEPPDCYSTSKTGGELDVYHQFLFATGSRPNEPEAVPITFDMYKKGYFILAWDRTPNKDNGYFNNEVDTGYIDLNIRLTEALTNNNRMVVVYSSYKQDIEMNGDRLEMKKICI